MTDEDLGFFYFGLYAALRRYRFMSILGWCVVLAGGAALPLAWNDRSLHPLTDGALGLALIVAGLALVQQSVASLEAYMSVPFEPSSQDPGGPPPALREILDLMQEVRSGGWQEAYRAIGRLRKLEEVYGLPPLTRAGRSAYIEPGHSQFGAGHGKPPSGVQ